MNRSPAVAGSFYPKDPQSLREDVASHIEPEAAKSPALGIVVPHAGFMYSGDVAGSVYSQIEIPDTVILMGPNHTGQGADISLMPKGTWSMPMGEVSIDEELAGMILKASPLIRSDDRAHVGEHSLETQLPFLQFFQKNIRMVPLVFMKLNFEKSRLVSQALVDAIRQVGRPVLLVASSDMTHFESHDSACQKDHKAIDHMLQLDERALFETVRKEKISMCGIHPVTVMMQAVKQLGATRCELVHYMTSGQVNGDLSHVVGYAGLVLR